MKKKKFYELMEVNIPQEGGKLTFFLTREMLKLASARGKLLLAPMASHMKPVLVSSQRSVIEGRWATSSQLPLPAPLQPPSTISLSSLGPLLNYSLSIYPSLYPSSSSSPLIPTIFLSNGSFSYHHHHNLQQYHHNSSSRNFHVNLLASSQKKKMKRSGIVSKVSPKRMQRVAKLAGKLFFKGRVPTKIKGYSYVNVENQEEKKQDKSSELPSVKKKYPSSLTFAENQKVLKQKSVDTKSLEYVNKCLAGKRRGKNHVEVIKKRLKTAEPEQRELFKSMTFIASAKAESSVMPPLSANCVEVCFAGRSNVGKSSLLNTLISSGAKAFVSDRPGHTQSLNFYKCSKKLVFIDLPGYGFAFSSPEVREGWNELIKNFISTRKTLKRVFVLVDCRQGLKESDIDFLYFLHKNKVRNQIILTKTDALYPDELAKRIHHMKDTLQRYSHTERLILLSSTYSKAGILEIQKTIHALVKTQQWIDEQQKR